MIMKLPENHTREEQKYVKDQEVFEKQQEE